MWKDVDNITELGKPKFIGLLMPIGQIYLGYALHLQNYMEDSAPEVKSEKGPDFVHLKWE